MKRLWTILWLLLAPLVVHGQVYPGAAWETWSSPAAAGFNTSAFNTALAGIPSPAVVIRGGKIVGSNGNLATTGFVWSASKSLTGLIAARQLQLGSFAYDDTVPGSDNPSAPLATHRQFLNMTSDYQIDEPSHSPGNHFAYNNAAFHFYGTHLKTTFYAGRTHVETLQDAYVSTLGFQDALDYNTSGFMSGWDGGWSMSTRDLARVAYLALRRGKWNTTQVLSAGFVDDLYANQVPLNATAANESDPFVDEEPISAALPGAYSFAFWLPWRITSGTSSMQPGCPAKTPGIAMLGAFGTTAHIVPSLDLIIVAVSTSGEHGGGKVTCASLDAIAAAVLPQRGARGKAIIKGRSTAR